MYTNPKYTSTSPFQGGKMNSSDDDSDDFNDDGEELQSKGKILNSSAALGKYDVKITKRRVPLEHLEDEIDLSQQIGAIRKEVIQRKSMQDEGKERDEDESILNAKRFDECNVSSLTVRALSEAGYVQLTRVQEATLSACLEGLCVKFMTLFQSIVIRFSSSILIYYILLFSLSVFLSYISICALSISMTSKFLLIILIHFS